MAAGSTGGAHAALERRPALRVPTQPHDQVRSVLELLFTLSLPATLYLVIYSTCVFLVCRFVDDMVITDKYFKPF